MEKMNGVKPYKDLIVWQKSMELAKEIFRLISLFPSSERYGIVSQMKRAGVSVHSNIAEGYGRKSPGARSQFFLISLGSIMELGTQLILAKELKFTKGNEFTQTEGLIDEISRMLNSMYSKLRFQSKS